MERLFFLIPLCFFLLFSCSEDKNECESYYDRLCSKEKYFDEPEEYFYQQKVKWCNCIKGKRSDFTDYEKIECDRYLESFKELDESVPDQKKVLQECEVGNRLLDKYGDLYISTCLLANGTAQCEDSKSECVKGCPSDSEEAFKGCISECDYKYPCDKICNGFEY